MTIPTTSALTLLSLVGCLRAARPVPDSQPLRYAGRFEVAVPDGWEVTRNWRFAGNRRLVLRAPQNDAAITVEMVREDWRSRDLPLSVVADVAMAEAGRSLGIAAEPLGQHQLLLAGREAWATTLRRHQGPASALATAVTLRADHHLVVLTLHSTAAAPPVPAWDLVLSSFALPRDPPPDTPPFAEDAAMEAALDAVRAGGPEGGR
ncbi:MAG: hypothetical protein H6739_23220 [Alphaproteobacteria bacterium]|nr:hypothetical protein [Alphaproteobacteria bacterium]